MTGRIKSLDVADGSGVILTEDGLIVAFCGTAVMAFDIPTLAVGQAVGFELDDGRCPHALNVHVQWAPQSVSGTERHGRITRFGYIGFEHRGSVRAYLFENLAPGIEKRTRTVTADLALFARHHVGLQEGPALCLNLLLEELPEEGTTVLAPFERSLSDREMLAFVASRPVSRARRGPGRTHAASGTASRSY
jgi:hypothetical protein